MFQKVIRFCVKIVQRYMPDPFIFAIILTFIAFILAMIFCHQTPLDVIDNWGKGIWSLLAFSMQMALILITGSVLAAAPAVKRFINTLASLPKTPARAIALVTGFSAVACWINWGFGLIVAAIFAKEVAKKVKGVDYPLLIASAYSGFVVWHGGISASVLLAMSDATTDFAKLTCGTVSAPIPLSETVFSIGNLLISIATTIAIVIVNALMHPKGEHVVCIEPSLLYEKETILDVKCDTPAERMESSRILLFASAVLGFAYLIIHLFVKGGAFDLNTVILLFLFLGLVLHGTPKAYIRSFCSAVESSGGIILQFPFYAGLTGIIIGVGSTGVSLGEVVSNACVAVSTTKTYPLFTFLFSGLINMFVPSGGGQFAVQAPIMYPAGAALNVNHAITSLAIAWGDAWTNLIQPFWALPALAIAKLNAKDIMGFCIIDLIVTGIIICIGMVLIA